MIEYLNKTTWATLKPSEYGTGVFAIRDIPKGQVITDYSVHNVDKPTTVTVPVKDFDQIHPSIQRLILDRTMFRARQKAFTFVSPNSEQTLQSYMNHSTKPNITDMIANREIKEGEELLEDYTSLADELHPLVLKHHTYLQ